MSKIEDNQLQNRFEKMSKILDEKYDLLVSYHMSENKQTILSDDYERQRCRFCGKSYPEVTFKKVSHAISHMVGNRFLKSDYECDDCNQKFSVLETDYSAFMNLYHTMFSVHGKGGIPKYKLNSKANSKIEIGKDNVIKINVFEGEEPLIIWEEEDKKNNSIKIVGQRTYTPQNVLKALTKMALTVMPKEEMNELQRPLDWIMGKPGDELMLPVLFRFYRSSLDFPYCAVFKRKNIPDLIAASYIFVLAYNNVVVQMSIPCVKVDFENKDKKISMPIVPTPLDLIELPFYKDIVRLSGKEKVRGERVEMGLKYEKVIESKINNSDE